MNFVTADVCKRCKVSLDVISESNNSQSETAKGAELDSGSSSNIGTSSNPNLLPCPDCSRECSLSAASCPQCGHIFIQTATRPLIRANFVTLAALIIGICVIGGGFYMFTRPKTTIAVEADPTASPNSSAKTIEVPAISPESLAAAKTALSALRRVGSAVDAGVSYNDYNNRVLDAKADMDEAMSAVRPQNETERQFFSEVLAAMDDHVAAKSAWNEIVTDYDHPHLHAEYHKTLLEKYGISTTYSSGECKFDWVSVSRNSILDAIWESAAKHTKNAAQLIPAN